MKSILELTKIKITILTTLSGLMGYYVAAGLMDVSFFMVGAGLFLLASGSSALNQFQERDWDAQMSRTKERPIPAGKIQPGAALLISFLLIIAGLGFIYAAGHVWALLFGMLAVVWYNFIYTPLKRISAFAVVPGAVIGSIPPAIGWVAAGRNLSDPVILVLMFFFFIWQIPHFWMLLLILSPQYEKAGYPSLLKVFNSQQLGRLTFIWTLATIVTSMMLPLFGILRHPILFFLLLIVIIWVLKESLVFLSLNKMNHFNIRRNFMAINVYALSVIALIIVQVGI
ncbi:MAG: hypothetical protein Kow00108_19100 [Calditrichia bacterium]